MPIDYQNDLGLTLLHVAAQNGNKRIAKLCLRKGADVNKRNNNGQVGNNNDAASSVQIADFIIKIYTNNRHFQGSFIPYYFKSLSPSARETPFETGSSTVGCVKAAV